MATLPQHRQLVEALFAYDLVGFHTAETGSRPSTAYVVAEAGGRRLPDGRPGVPSAGRIRAAVFPIGIDAADFVAMVGQPARARGPTR
jgi:trehalose 6-phosphate synthase